MNMISGFTAITWAQSEGAVMRLQLEEWNREESPHSAPYPIMTALRTVTVIATITPRLQLVSAAEGGPRSGSRSGDSRTEAIVGHSYRPTRMLVPSDTDASVVRYESTFRPIRTGDDGQERANNGHHTCRRWSGRLTKTIKRMLEMVINLVEMVINLVEVVINFAEMVINLSEMVRRVVERISVIIGRVAGRATVKSRTRGAAGSIGYIAGAVVVATAVYTLLIYIGGSVCLVSRRINTMPGRGCMVGRRGNVEGRRVNMVGRRINIMLGRSSMEGANAQTLVGRVGSAVGSVRIKATKKGSTEVLPLDILLI